MFSRIFGDSYGESLSVPSSQNSPIPLNKTANRSYNTLSLNYFNKKGKYWLKGASQRPTVPWPKCRLIFFHLSNLRLLRRGHKCLQLSPIETHTVSFQHKSSLIVFFSYDVERVCSLQICLKHSWGPIVIDTVCSANTVFYRPLLFAPAENSNSLKSLKFEQILKKFWRNYEKWES